MRARASRSRRTGASTTTAGAAAAALLSQTYSWMVCYGFTATSINDCNTAKRYARPLYIYAPPGSGYVRPSTDEDDDQDDSLLTRSDLTQISPPAFPSTYEPMLEYPGTMRPGRTPENMPYHDLPNLGINDPDPVPWPHFQEIEWHHRWDPPHPQALAMEEFIEVQGRWASVEEEAEMRMGMRRGVRERRETEELAGKGGGASGASGAQQMVIMDDEEEEDGGGENDGRNSIGIGLGDGVEALLKIAADNAARATESDESQDDDEDAGDDFLLDLGLGGDDETEEAEEGGTSNKQKRSSEKSAKTKASAVGEDDADAEDDLDLDFELGFDLDEDDDIDAEDDEDEEKDGDFDNYDDEEDISIDDYTKEDDGGDDDEFDDGGFDYGD